MPDPQPLNYQSREDFNDETGGVLRSLFGQGHARIWKTFAEQIAGQLEPDDGLIPKPRLYARIGAWPIVLDVVWSGEYALTRMRLSFVNPSRFRFYVRREGFLVKVGKLLGMQDIRVGHDDFDSQFIVQSNQPDTVRRLLDDTKLRDLLHAQPAFEMLIRDTDRFAGPRFTRPLDELTYQARGVARDLKLLHDVHDLFARTVDLVHNMRIAEAP